PPARLPATESPRLETAAQRSHDRPQAGSTTSAPTVPPSDSGGESRLHPTSPDLPDPSQGQPTGRSTTSVATPGGRPAPDPSMLRSAAGSAAETHPTPAPASSARPV